MAYLILWGIHLEPRAFPHLHKSDYTAFSPSSSINSHNPLPFYPYKGSSSLWSKMSSPREGELRLIGNTPAPGVRLKGHHPNETSKQSSSSLSPGRGIKQSFALRILWLHKNILKIIKNLWQQHPPGTTLDHLFHTPWKLYFFNALGYLGTNAEDWHLLPTMYCL